MLLPRGNTFGIGANVTLDCQVEGYPKPYVTWFRNDAEIQQSYRVQITGYYFF